MYASQQPVTFSHPFLSMNIMAFIFDALKIVNFSITSTIFFCPLYSATNVFFFSATMMSSLGSSQDHGREWHAIQQRTVTSTARSRRQSKNTFPSLAVLAVLTTSLMTCGAIIFSSSVKVLYHALSHSPYPSLYVGR